MNLRSVEFLESRIAVLQPMAAELSVDDPTMITVVKRPVLWYDEQQWDLYLPENDYRLCVATAEIVDRAFQNQGFINQPLAPAEKCVAIFSGRSRLELLQIRTEDGWIITVLQDDREILKVHKSVDWNSGGGSSGGGYFPRQQELKADAPVVLFRRRFNIRAADGSSSTPPGPAEGLLLWIEPNRGEAP